MTTLNVPTAHKVRVSAASSESDWADARRLTSEMIHWLAETLSLDVRVHQHDSNEEFDSLESFYVPPRGTMLLGHIDGVACGTTGVAMMDGETAELRRVWVTPAARGKGLAPVLLNTALETARSLGARRVCLETAAGQMDKAIAMYTRAGFQPIPQYSSLPDTIPNILTLGMDLA